MSPIHFFPWIGAFAFQIVNGISIGGWLAGYGKVTRAEWANNKMDYVAGARMELGLMIFAIGLILNIFHDDELREIRRAARRNQQARAAEADKSTGKAKAADGKTGVDKVYFVPQNGLFWLILYPHYLCEWIEWAGYWIMGGADFVPGRIFLMNEIATMTPRAVNGKKWYLERFGKEKIGNRKAIIPGIL